MQNKFPKNFLWGVATSAYQIEGGNFRNDWHEWEDKRKTKDKCGQACDYWNRFKTDHDLAKELGCNAFRLSIEWSRVEPEDGKFDERAIEHYRDILRDLKERNIAVVITLWHWTNPSWFSKNYGWHENKSIEVFARYCDKIVDSLGDLIGVYVTLNEPRIFLNKGYLAGVFPPGKNNLFKFLKARKNLAHAHQVCYEIIKDKFPKATVGLTQFVNDFDFYGPPTFLSRLVERIEEIYNFNFFDGAKYFDFIGINYYYTVTGKLVPLSLKIENDAKEKSDMNWGVHPEGLYEIAKDAWKKFRKPIYVFENGIADDDDTLRPEFISSHLEWLGKAINEGADVRGYFHWSLLDNFEWTEGYRMRFGLVEVDFETQKRKPRNSFYIYKKIIQENS